jgi:hypothetical protein
MRAVLLADMHVGGLYGVAGSPESKFAPDAGVRQKLFDAWSASTRGKWSKPDALIVNGDAVDGKGVKSGGVDQWEPDLMAQADHAAELLSMWGAKEVYIIRGSPYHVGAGHTGLEVEEYLGRKIGAMVHPYGKDQQSGLQWFLTLNGTTMHVSHHVGISRVFAYRSTPIAREMMAMKLNDPLRHLVDLASKPGGRNQLWNDDLKAAIECKTSIVVRAHSHYFWVCQTSHSMGIDLPCWQAMTPYMQLRNPIGMPPDIGFIGMEFNKGGEWTYERNLWRVESMQTPPHSIVQGWERPSRSDHQNTRARHDH